MRPSVAGKLGFGAPESQFVLPAVMADPIERCAVFSGRRAGHATFDEVGEGKQEPVGLAPDSELGRRCGTVPVQPGDGIEDVNKSLEEGSLSIKPPRTSHLRHYTNICSKSQGFRIRFSG